MALGEIAISAYDPHWPANFARERDNLAPLHFLAIEHFGSTAIPGLRAKAVIDIMAKVESLSVVAGKLRQLETLGYVLIATGMPDRLFLRKEPVASAPAVHLHILLGNDFDNANERLLRDHLLTHPDLARAYGNLKDRLASEFRNDREAYTKAKTAFIQTAVDAARDARGLPRVNVWVD